MSATFLLWSNVLKKYFPLSPPLGTSAAVESSFNNVKIMIFKNFTLPIRADEFVLHDILANDGETKLTESAIILSIIPNNITNYMNKQSVQFQKPQASHDVEFEAASLDDDKHNAEENEHIPTVDVSKIVADYNKDNLLVTERKWHFFGRVYATCLQ